MPPIIILNASRMGENGNSHVLSQLALEHLPQAEYVVLKDHLTPVGIEELLRLIQKSGGVLMVTGTHWDSWSSVLQHFLEAITPTEGTAVWLGKPIGIIVSEHSTGGKGVLSRLQGVLVTFGCLIPPMSGIVYSLAGQNTVEGDHQGAADVWCRDDVRTLCHNLTLAAQLSIPWESWPVDRKDFEQVWVRE